MNSSTSPTPPTPADNVELRRARLASEGVQLPPEHWGLALSGGGIRSATFCLGLVSGLAQSKIFHRFDYLSTVSGGGYAGAAIGKLFHESTASTQGREQGLAGMRSSWFVWWLRATSRYLMPRGMKDVAHAGALMLRNLLAVHLELALLAVLAGFVMAGINLATWWGLDRLLPRYPDLLGHLYPLFAAWMSLWWLLAVVPLFAGLPYIASYWAVPANAEPAPTRRWPTERIVGAACFPLGLGALALAWLAAPFWDRLPDSNLRWVCTAGGFALVLVGLGPLVAGAARKAVQSGAQASPQELRNLLTTRLAFCLKALAACIGLGLLDRLAWWLAFGRFAPDNPVALPLLVACALAVTRMVAARANTNAGSPPVSLALRRKAVDAIGALLLALLTAWWISLVYRFGLGALFTQQDPKLDFTLAAVALVGMIVGPVVYMALSGRNNEFLNVSSLHMFYRARLTRSYLGAANTLRFTRPPLPSVDPLEPAESALAAANAEAVTVFEVHPGDAAPLAGYAPHLRGGPVHILNATVNQTYDARGGLYNQDRKGQSLSVASGGWTRLGTEAWRHDAAVAQTDLSLWMAVSGAAFTPGLGGQTSPGLAALLYLAGVRLGYWWKRETSASASASASTVAEAAATGWHRLMPKYALMLDEARGNFGGTRAPYWYLSDGGHFENTGAYALLRERTHLVVLADCGADPQYGFADVENLVRKARIDLDTDIEFWRPSEQGLASGATIGGVGIERFGSLAALKDAKGSACLALALVHYPDRAPGFLVLVKPNIYHGLPIDLINYKTQCSSFPQETTTDQFFSESQWESYFSLGRHLGRELDPQLLAGLDEQSVRQHFEEDKAVRQGSAASASATAVASASLIPPRIAAAAKPALGVAAIAAFAFSAWQGAEGFLNQQAAQEDKLRAALHTVAVQNEKVRAGDQAEWPVLRANLADLALRHCEGTPSVLARVPNAAAVFKESIARCQAEPGGDAGPACEVLTRRATGECLNATPVRPDAPVYWGRAYDDPETLRLALARAEPKETVAVAAAATAPAPAAAPVVVPAPAAVPSPAPPPTPDASCKGKTIYTQIYGPQRRDEATALTRAWSGSDWGASAPGVEDVFATAAARQRQVPSPMVQTTVMFHTPAEAACASRIAASLDGGARTRPLPGRYTGQAGTIEVWLAPR